MLDFSPSELFQEFVEDTPAVDRKAWVQLQREIDRLKREERPEGRFQYVIKGEGVPDLVFDFYLSKGLKKVFGLAGHLKRKGEPSDDVKEVVEKAIKFIQIAEQNKNLRSDYDAGGKS